MKAVLLAAGEGRRLRPLTETIPKCLVPVLGRPLMSIWFDHFLKAGVDEVLINTHYLPDAVEEFAAASAPAGLSVKLVYEPVLLGSAGTVRNNREFLSDEESFFVIYADNLTDMDLTPFLQFHNAKNSIFSLGLFKTPSPAECGIAELDEHQKVIGFIEKPKSPKSNLANAGLYVMGREVLDLIPDQPNVDFGFDILPQLVGKMYGYPIPGMYFDLGTLERLNMAEAAWAKTYG